MFKKLQNIPQWAKILITVILTVSAPVWALPFLVGYLLFLMGAIIYGMLFRRKELY